MLEDAITAALLIGAMLISVWAFIITLAIGGPSILLGAVFLGSVLGILCCVFLRVD